MKLSIQEIKSTLASKLQPEVAQEKVEKDGTKLTIRGKNRRPIYVGIKDINAAIGVSCYEFTKDRKKQVGYSLWLCEKNMDEGHTNVMKALAEHIVDCTITSYDADLDPRDASISIRIIRNNPFAKAIEVNKISPLKRGKPKPRLRYSADACAVIVDYVKYTEHEGKTHATVFLSLSTSASKAADITLIPVAELNSGVTEDKYEDMDLLNDEDMIAF